MSLSPPPLPPSPPLPDNIALFYVILEALQVGNVLHLVRHLTFCGLVKCQNPPQNVTSHTKMFMTASIRMAELML